MPGERDSQRTPLGPADLNQVSFELFREARGSQVRGHFAERSCGGRDRTIYRDTIHNSFLLAFSPSCAIYVMTLLDGRDARLVVRDASGLPGNDVSHCRGNRFPIEDIQATLGGGRVRHLSVAAELIGDRRRNSCVPI